MENTLANRCHIIDSFRYLVCCVGFCDAYFSEHHGWTVTLNGQRFQQEYKSLNTPQYVFTCKTESGTVTVSFLHGKAI